MLKLRFILIFLLIGWLVGKAQTSFQDCFGAIPVCDSIYIQPNGYFDSGNVDELALSSTCLVNGENNSVWYIFTVTTPGNMQFDLTPANQDDYDFALFNLTNATCSDIVTGALQPVRCNFAPTVGVATGLRSGFSNTTAGVNGDTFLAPLPVQVNETYVLLVDNFTDGGDGYLLDFTGGSANIVDNIPPSVDTIETLDCDTTRSLLVYFSEPIACNSVLFNGSQFTLTGNPNIGVIGALPVNCDSSSFTQSIQLTLAAPILTGEPYTIGLQNGSNGSGVLDICGNSATGETFVFTPPAIVLPRFTVRYRASCIADTAVFTNTSAPSVTNGNPVWAWSFGDGSMGSTMQAPTHVYPGYTSYDVTLTATTDDGCTYSFDSTITVERSYVADFEYDPIPACPNVPIQFSDISPGSADTWFWDFGDGSISADQNPTHVFLEPGTYPVKLIIADNASVPPCSDSVTIDVVVNDDSQAAFQIDVDQICAGEPVTFEDLTSGNPIAWNWRFGDGTIDSAQSPTHVFDSTGVYEVELLVNNGCGDDSVTQTYTVNEVPVFDLGNDTILCFDAVLNLVAFTGADEIRWSTGETSDSITLTQVPANIGVTVTNDGCVYEDAILIDEQTEDCAVVPLPSAFSPNNDGINDGFRLVNPQRISDVEIHIFNRWGQEVYSSNRINFNWDGTLNGEEQPIGVYTYYMTYSVFTSTGKQSGFYVRSSVTLIR